MTLRAGIVSTLGVADHASTRIPQALALAILLLAAATLGGCSLKLVAQRVSLPFVRARPKTSDLQASLIDVREQSALHPQEPYWPYRLGQLYLGADSLKAAEAALRASLEIEGTYAPALSLLSKLYFESSRNQDAVNMLEPVRSRPDAFPDDIRQVLLAGLALHQDALGRTDLADAAISPAPRADDKRSASAMVYVTLRGSRPDSAAGLASAALHEEPNSAVNLNNFGITRLRAGDPTSARRAFMSAIEREPNLPGPYYNLAILEKFYLFDDTAASGWFGSYWKRSHDDPDSLSGALADSSQKHLAQRGN